MVQWNGEVCFSADSWQDTCLLVVTSAPVHLFIILRHATRGKRNGALRALKEDMRMSPPSLRSVGNIPASLSRPARLVDPALLGTCLGALGAQETGMSVSRCMWTVVHLSLFGGLYEPPRGRDKEPRYECRGGASSDWMGASEGLPGTLW